MGTDLCWAVVRSILSGKKAAGEWIESHHCQIFFVGERQQLAFDFALKQIVAWLNRNEPS